MTADGYTLLLPFDTDEPEFARGFEAGRMWERVKNDHTTWDGRHAPSSGPGERSDDG